MKYFILLCALVAAVGCDDDVTNVPLPDSTVLPDMAADQGVTDATFDAAEPEPIVDMAPPPGPGWILVDIAPRRSLYAAGDTFTASAEVFDVFGEDITPPVEWRLDPPTIGAVDASGAVTLSGEGQGFVVACVDDVCGQAGFFVDNAPPGLIVESPEANARLTGFAGRNLTVSGRASDSRGQIAVHVNGEPADVDAEGRFAIDLQADFGVNRVTIVADDGVRTPVQVVRDVMWAPRWRAADETGVDLPGAMALRLDQTLLDADAEVEIPQRAGEASARELAAFVAALIGLVDGRGLLGDPEISSSESLTLTIDSISLGEPEVDIGFTAAGLELFIRLPGMTVNTRGHLVIEDQRLSLNGSINASMVAFAEMSLSLGEDGSFQVQAGEIGVAVERIEGDFANESVEALLSALGSQLNAVVRGLVLDLVEGVVRDSLPGAVQTALSGILESLERLPLNIDLGIEGLSPVRMELLMQPARMGIARRTNAGISLDGRIQYIGEPPVALHPDPGVPELSEPDAVDVPGGGLGLSARLMLINALLHEVWRGGLLRFQPPLPAQFAGLLGEVRVDAEIPPIVAPAPPDIDFPLVADVVMKLEMQPEGLPEPHLFSLRLRAGIGIAINEGRFGLTIAESPVLDAALIRRGNDQAPPLGPDALEAFVEAALWPEVQEALTRGLDLDLSPVDVDVGAFFDIAPRVEGLSIGPVFEGDAFVQDGRLHLEGALEVLMQLGN